MNYNAILKISDSSVAAEPVTLQEAKDYMRLEGFVDADASTVEALSDFTFDDTLITNLIIQAREILENSTGDQLKVKTMTVIATNLCGMIKLPGPVTTAVMVVDENGVTLDTTSVVMVGDYMRIPVLKNMTLTYTAGFTTCPKNYKHEILRIVNFFYHYRGDEDRKMYVSRYPAKIWA